MSLHLRHGGAQLVRSAEESDDVGDLSVRGNWGNFEHVGQRELSIAVFGVFLN